MVVRRKKKFHDEDAKIWSDIVEQHIKRAWEGAWLRVTHASMTVQKFLWNRECWEQNLCLFLTQSTSFSCFITKQTKATHFGNHTAPTSLQPHTWQVLACLLDNNFSCHLLTSLQPKGIKLPLKFSRNWRKQTPKHSDQHS